MSLKIATEDRITFGTISKKTNGIPIPNKNDISIAEVSKTADSKGLSLALLYINNDLKNIKSNIIIKFKRLMPTDLIQRI